MLNGRLAFLLALMVASLIAPVDAATDLTQMYVSPTIVQVGVETEVTIGYSEGPHMEGQIWVEGKVIRGYLPSFQGAGVSVVRYRDIDRGGGELALDWRVVIKPTEVELCPSGHTCFLVAHPCSRRSSFVGHLYCTID